MNNNQIGSNDLQYTNLRKMNKSKKKKEQKEITNGNNFRITIISMPVQ